MPMIYVDPLMNHGWILRGHFVESCHLFSDKNDAELNDFAKIIGLRGEWCQRTNIVTHYDLTSANRTRAIAAGAIEVGRRAAVQIWRHIRQRKLWGEEMKLREAAARRLLGSEETLEGFDPAGGYNVADSVLVARAYLEPIPMLLFCPQCGTQHIDQEDEKKGWTNPPHRSHECQACFYIWRPCDRPTTGVAAILTVGQHDRPPFPKTHHVDDEPTS